jgi:hypothetical protein
LFEGRKKKRKRREREERGRGGEKWSGKWKRVKCVEGGRGRVVIEEEVDRRLEGQRGQWAHRQAGRVAEAKPDERARLVLGTRTGEEDRPTHPQHEREGRDETERLCRGATDGGGWDGTGGGQSLSRWPLWAGWPTRPRETEKEKNGGKGEKTVCLPYT